ncbi:unnamed protein product, partial [Ectocarpus sp. 12 AP-2014]
MTARRPPPSYEETLGRGEDALNMSPFSSTPGRPNGAAPVPAPAVDYSSNRSSAHHGGERRRSGGGGGGGGGGGVSASLISEIQQSLHGTGFKVVYYPPHKGRPQERMVWMNKTETEFALVKNAKSSVRNFIGKKIVHPVASLLTVTLGVPPSEIYLSRDSTGGRSSSGPWRLSNHVPDPRLTIRLRFSTDTVDFEGCTPDESNALFAILSPYARSMPHPAKGAISEYAGAPRRSSPRPAAAAVRENGGGRPALDEGSDPLEVSYKANPIPVQNPAIPNGGVPRRQRSNLRDMMQQGSEYDKSREVFLAHNDLDDGVDAAAVALKPYTLAEVSGAVPQTPSCYVHREDEITRLAEALGPGGGTGVIGGATTVIFDSVANGKSVLAAAAMQDPRVQAAFPGGVIWLRAGHSAADRLLR